MLFLTNQFEQIPSTNLVVMAMTVTIQQVLRPLLIVRFVLGLGVYPITQLKLKIQWIKYLSMVYILTIWFAYSYVFYHTVTFFTFNVIFRSIPHKTILVMNVSITIISVIKSLYYEKVSIMIIYLICTICVSV